MNVTVTVAPLPVVTASAASPTICSGSSTVLTANGATSYVWSPSTNLSSTTVSNPTASPTSTITYSVIGTTGTCSSLPANVTVTVTPLPVVTASVVSSPICSGGSTGLTANGATSYVWSPSTNLSSTTVSNPTASPTTTTIYSVIGTTGTCSSLPVPVTVTVIPRPVVTASAVSPTICAGASTTLTANGATSYVWSPATSLSSTTVSNPTANPTIDTDYSVIGTTLGCVSAPVKVTVKVSPLPDPTFAYSKSIYCQNESNPAPISVPLGSIFTANSGNVSINSGTGLIDFTTSLAGTYIITNTITNAAFCTKTATFSLTIQKAPVATTFSYATPICDADQSVVVPTTIKLGDVGSFSTNPLGLIIDPSTGEITTSGSVSTTYKIVYTSKIGTCLDSSFANFTLNSSPSKPALTGSNSICQGLSTILTASSGVVLDFDWYNGNTLVQSGGNTFTTSISGDYAVASTGVNGCTSLKSTILKLVVSPKPSAPIIQGACIVSVPPVTLSTDYSLKPGYSYKWFKDKISFGNTSTLIANVTGKYSALVTDIATSCTSDTSVEIDPFTSVVALSITSGSNPFCVGDSLVVTSSSATGNTWKLNGNTISSSQSVIVKNAGELILSVTSTACSGNDTLDVVTNPLPNPIFAYSKSVYCQNETNPVSVSIPLGSVFTANSGNITINKSTGLIDLNSSIVGIYTITNTVTNALSCSKSSTFVLTIQKSSKAIRFTYPTPICSSSLNPISPSIISLGDVGVYSSVPSGLVIDPNSGFITIKGSLIGAYKVVYTSTSGSCTDTSSANFVINPLLSKPSLTGPTSICQGKSSILTATSGSITNFDWYNGNTLVQSGGNTYSASLAGDYSAVAISVDGCNSINSDALKLTVSPIPSTPIIQGACLVSVPPVTLSTDYSSKSGYSYNWLKDKVVFGSTSTISANALGKYSILVTDITTGCISDTSAEIDPFTNAISLSITSGVNPFCVGDSLQATSSSATGNTWKLNGNTISSSQSVIVKNAGKLILSVISTGCSGNDTLQLVTNPLPNSSFAYSKSLYCHNELNPSPISVPSGSVFTANSANITINKSTGLIDLNSSIAGIYTITNIVTNASSCSKSSTFVLTIQKSSKAIRFTYPTPICSSSLNPISPSIISLGDVGVYSSVPSGLVIDPNSGFITIKGSLIGAYKVVYTSTSGSCTDTSSANFVINPLLSKPSLTGPTSICQGKSSILTATSGSITNFDWYNGNTLVQSGGNTYSASLAGDYSAVAISVDGCNSINSDALKLTVSPIPSTPIIQGACLVSVPPVTLSTDYSSKSGYSYNWLKDKVVFGSTSTISANALGKYSILVTDITTGCISDTSAEIDPFTNAISLSITSGTNPFCIGDSLQVTSSSATGNTWKLNGNTISSSQSVIVKNAGELILSVISTGCSGNDTLNVVANPLPIKPIITSVSDSICSGGSIVLSTTAGGNFQWKLDGINIALATSSTLTVSVAGAYKVTSTSGFCSAISDVKNIGITSSPTKPILSLNGAQTICASDLPQITILNFVSGQDQWFMSGSKIPAPAGASQILALTASGLYKVVRTTSAGCTAVSDSANITLATPFKVKANLLLDPTCTQKGAIHLGTDPKIDFTVQSNSLLVKDSINNNLDEGVYSGIKITDKVTGCSIDTNFTLRKSIPFKVRAIPINPSCNGKDGTILFEILPKPTSNYTISGDLFSAFNPRLGARNYTVTIKDKISGCEIKDTVFKLVSRANFTLDVNSEKPLCGDSTGSLELKPRQGSITDYTFIVSGKSTQSKITKLPSGSYPVKITNASNCTLDTILVLPNEADFKLTAKLNPPSCLNNDGSIFLSVRPGKNEDYVFSGPYFTDSSITSKGSDLYNVRVTRKNTTCFIDSTFELKQNVPFSVKTDKIDNPSCNKSDGSITISVLPVGGGYIFPEKIKLGKTPDLAAGPHKLTVQDKNGCKFDTTYILQESVDFKVKATVKDAACGKAVGEIKLDIQPSTSTDIYTIKGLTSQNATGLAAKDYIITITRQGSTCAFDTLIKIGNVLTLPLISLGVNDTIAICDNKSKLLKVKLTDSLNVAYQYSWYARKDTLKFQLKDTLTVNPDSTTRYIVEVKLGDGCASFDTVVVAKPSTIILENTTHDYANDKFVKLNFRFKNRTDYPSDSIYVYRKGNASNDKWIAIDSIPNNRKEFYNTLADQTKGPFYYKVGLENKLNVCAEKLESKAQRTVNLVATRDYLDDEAEISYLNWNTFINWDSAVVEYQVWRGVEGGEIAYYFSGNLDTVVNYMNGTDARKQCYRIRAIEKSTNRESWSNISCVDFVNRWKAYNIFTPNGDGYNDFLMIKNIKFYPGNEIHVFNRWGNKVFSQTNYANDWDGDGLPAGTYYYILDLKDGSKPIQKDILLHR